MPPFLLDALGAIGEAYVIMYVGAFLLTVIPFLVLVGRMWSEHIDQQLDREWDEQRQRKAASVRAGRWLLLLGWLRAYAAKS